MKANYYKMEEDRRLAEVEAARVKEHREKMRVIEEQRRLLAAKIDKKRDEICVNELKLRNATLANQLEESVAQENPPASLELPPCSTFQDPEAKAAGALPRPLEQAR